LIDSLLEKTSENIISGKWKTFRKQMDSGAILLGIRSKAMICNAKERVIMRIKNYRVNKA
jgi:hypothetical protein